MIERSPPPVEVAQRLMAHVAPSNQPSDAWLDAVDQAYRELRDRMVLLLGKSGFDALWARALHQVQPDMSTLPMLVNSHDPTIAGERVAAVFANCFTLLYTFIGDDLSFRLLQQTWPTIPFVDSQEHARRGN